ncbi:hypothetical protein [Croceimicrobium hydrocarbonivorans]|uniref:YopX protein domain-containing protein n=1 Tax=Croceimicrobium hydrocarbonivorans TaxID=2761580 RepID=A0A7H0VFE3_9FLAO|nr:hypothetical protein [Croceimicrobium hydrocarbonivorans]QNR24441.1 hypothetical protein H4K34_00960 [Croceimicrobium hydrocarbonivorans]
MGNPERRFRLRQDHEIVGYMRKLSERMVLFSKDGFWWRGYKPEYNEVDEFIGIRDCNNRYIYEWDILYFKVDPDGPYEEGVILWEGNQQVFGIKAIRHDSFFPLELEGISLFNPRELRVFSHLWLNPELKRQLGVQD